MSTYKIKLEKIKYFRYIDDYWKGDINHLHDFDFCIYLVTSFDSINKTLKAYNTMELDPFEETFTFDILSGPNVEILDTKIMDQFLKTKKEEAIHLAEEENKRLKQEEEKLNQQKNKHFELVQSDFSRGQQVTLFHVPHSWIDFTTPQDAFYVDDVRIMQEELIYSLKVIGPKKNRGTYTFYTEFKFRKENLKYP